MTDRNDKNNSVQGGTNERKKSQGKELLVTKESFCAVFALFSILAFVILISGNSIFGEPGAYMQALLFGVFGYAAYPITVLTSYACIMGFIGKRMFKNRKAVAAFLIAIVLGGMVAHSVQTCFIWQWSMDGYLKACFEAGGAFPAVTAFGWLGGLLVYALSSIITPIGGLVVFSAVTLLAVYIFVKLALANSPERTKPARGENAVAQTTPVDSYPQANEDYADRGYEKGYHSNEAEHAKPQPAPNASQGFQAEQPNAGYAPNTPKMPYTVRQRPGFVIQEDEYMQSRQKQSMPSEQTPAGNAEAETQERELLSGYSPFGLNLGIAQPQNTVTPEQSRQILFGATPKQNYQDNLIFDTNSSANRRPIGNFPSQNAQLPQSESSSSQSVPFSQGASYAPASQPAPTYSQQYQQSIQSSEPIRPKKIVSDSGENFGGRPASNLYGLDLPQAPTRNSFESTERLTSREPFEETNSRAGNNEINLSNNRRGDEFTLLSGENSGAGRSRDIPEADNFPNAERLPDSRIVEQTASLREDGGRRHDYMDLFSMDNPNVFGTSGNRMGNRDVEDTDRTDRSSLFEDELPEPSSGSRSMREDPYRLQSYDGEQASESDSFGGRVEQTRSERSSSEFTQTERFVEPTVQPAQSMQPISAPQETPIRQAEPQIPPAQPIVQKVEVEVKVQPASVPAPEPKPEPPKPRYHKPYVRVPLHYFNCSENPPDSNVEEVEEIKRRIVETLEDYNVMGGTIGSVTFGPTVTRYNVILPRGVSPKKVVSLEQEIAMGLCREGINVYLNVEDGAVSIEVPNANRQTVELGSMFIDDAYTKAKPTSLVFAMGKDIANRKVYGDVCKMTHLLVAGSSGSGKSVFLGCLIISLITKYSPDELRMILIDPKKTEFVLYNNLPHLMINEIISDCKKAVQSLSWAIGEMERRYSLIQKKSLSGTYVVNIDEYNANLEPGEEKLPKIVIIVDELADLMLNAKKDMEDKIQSLTQKARAAGIHLILATQRPSTDVITGVIKSNLPTRIAFTVATDVDSRVILDQTGAQKLLGKGDMVYTASGINTPVRVQSPFISSSDSQKVVNFIKENNEAYFDESATSFINNARSGGNGGDGGDSVAEIDPVYLECLKLVIQTQTASISMLQRKCSIGFNKAGKIIEWMEEMEFVSPYEGAKRRVLITQDEYVERFGEW